MGELRGTKISVGETATRYRQGVEDAALPAWPRAPRMFGGSPAAGGVGRTVGDAALEEVSATDALEGLNRAFSRPTFGWRFALAAFVIAVVWWATHRAFFGVLTGLDVFVALIVGRLDRQRRLYRLNYDLDAEARKRFAVLNRALWSLARAKRIWYVVPKAPGAGRDRPDGSSSLRYKMTIRQCAPETVESNVTPYCLNLGHSELFFYPDYVYILQNGRFRLMGYKGLSITPSIIEFAEPMGVPSDARPVGSQWLHRNWNRGRGNRQVPVVRYGVVRLRSPAMADVVLHVSSLAAVEQFAQLLRSIGAGHSSKPQAEAREPEPPPKPKRHVPAFYGVLRLEPGCTREDATARYRLLVRAYHPDRAAQMSPEFQRAATEKMQEINVAFDELKQLRGW